MEYVLLTLKQVTAMLIIAVITIIIYKKDYIDKKSSKSISNLLLMVVNPALVFYSFQNVYTKERLEGFFFAVLLSFGVHFLGSLLSRLFLGKNHPYVNLEQFACIYSNCGFIGIPIINAVFGQEGVFYLTGYMIVFNLWVWTHGLMKMTGRHDLKQLKEFLISPMLAAIVLGLITFLGQLPVPELILNTAGMIADMNTPLAMVVAGLAIADANVKGMLKKRRIYLVAFLKLLVIPIVFLLLCSKLPIPFIVKSAIVAAAACPTATTGTMFAIRYGGNAEYMAEMFSITTILSVFTIPIVIYLIQIF